MSLLFILIIVSFGNVLMLMLSNFSANTFKVLNSFREKDRAMFLLIPTSKHNQSMGDCILLLLHCKQVWGMFMKCA